MTPAKGVRIGVGVGGDGVIDEGMVGDEWGSKVKYSNEAYTMSVSHREARTPQNVEHCTRSNGTCIPIWFRRDGIQE